MKCGKAAVHHRNEQVQSFNATFKVHFIAQNVFIQYTH